MRVTSDLFVSALLRRVFSSGGYGAVTRRGATEAGAIFVTVRGRDGSVNLYGPAAQADYAEGGVGDRRFTVVLAATDVEVDKRLQKEARFDPDVWVVEVEPGADPIEALLSLTTP
mgnify:CR=1 FL=1